ncbi:hypothetical protein Cgig2_009163 [Carnegiea gigantea]|uniref:Uncharacterized protein n=1 Tax=Carnegiea gigantea TaxID=171969 RepID=A0A9Q1QH86_9CARY|nr:hypothetical protein Cgig2_009163 [Carnegiea gigantea]
MEGLVDRYHEKAPRKWETKYHRAPQWWKSWSTRGLEESSLLGGCKASQESAETPYELQRMARRLTMKIRSRNSAFKPQALARNRLTPSMEAAIGTTSDEENRDRPTQTLSSKSRGVPKTAPHSHLLLQVLHPLSRCSRHLEGCLPELHPAERVSQSINFWE